MYVHMAEFIGSENKTYKECYVLHDNMKQRYKSIDNILEQLKILYNIRDEDLIAEK